MNELNSVIYETKVFEPEIYGTTNAGKVSNYYRRAGKYTRIGNLVTGVITLSGDFDSANKPQGALRIKGLPLKCSSSHTNLNLDYASINHIILCFSKKQEYHATPLDNEIQVSYIKENDVNYVVEFGTDALDTKFDLMVTFSYFID